MFSQHSRRARRAKPGNSRYPIGWVSAQRDEIRDLLGVNSISRADFIGTNPSHFARANGEKNGGFIGRKLEHVAIAACDEHRATPARFSGDRGGDEIVGLVTGCLDSRKAAGSHESRQDVELLEQIVVEFASALIGRKLLVTIGRHVQSIPTDEHRARLLLAVEPQQEIRETEDRTGGSAATPQDGLG